MTSLAKCRICYSNKLVFTGGLGDIAISDFTDKPSKGLKYPLNLVYCQECSLVQLDRNIPREKLYSKYWYKSSTNTVVRDDLKEIAGLCKGLTISIGENDGTMFSYAKKAYPQIAVDPNQFESTGPQQWIHDYWENVKTDQADTIVAIAVIYDLPDPNKFIKNVKNHLKPEGTFIAEFEPLTVMIENTDLGFICHEHTEYYSYKSLVKLFEQNGLEIFKVEIVPINGGSYRIFARHYHTGSINFKEKEYTALNIKTFFRRIERNRELMKKWFFKTKPNIMIYGASTKGNTILQYYGIEHMSIVDINPEKVGKYTVASNCYITDEILPITEYLWVMPWGFLDYFKKKEKGYKGKWITTIPEFKIWG